MRLLLAVNAAAPGGNPPTDNASLKFDASKQRDLHAEARRLAAKGDMAAMERVLCPEPRTERSAVLIDQITRLARVARQLVENELRAEAVPVAEAALQRIEQVETRSDPDSATWKLQAKITKAYLFEKVLFDNERAYLSYRECAQLDPSRANYRYRADNLAPHLDNLRVYGAKTPALNRAYRGISRGATMDVSSFGDSVIIEVTGLTGDTHRLERSSDLIHWTAIAGPLRTRDRHEEVLKDSDGARFYRLTIENPGVTPKSSAK